MGQLHRVIVAGLVLAGCSKASEPEAEPRRELTRVAVRPVAQRVDDRFDANGQLQPSARRVAWLEVPRGFEEQPSTVAGSHSFVADDMPLDKVLSYLEERLTAQRLEPRGDGMTFRFARPLHSQLAGARLNVTAVALDRAEKSVRLDIDDLTPTAPPLTPEQAAELLARERARVE